jgi:DNA-directed RNA polymerase subunit RPC12/RpoP
VTGGQALIFCNSFECGRIIARMDVHKMPYEITCPYCGTHAKVMWRKKPYTKATKRDGWAISELRTAIIATHSQSRLGFMLQLQFGKT